MRIINGHNTKVINPFHFYNSLSILILLPFFFSILMNEKHATLFTKRNQIQMCDKPQQK